MRSEASFDGTRSFSIPYSAAATWDVSERETEPMTASPFTLNSRRTPGVNGVGVCRRQVGPEQKGCCDGFVGESSAGLISKDSTVK